MIALIAEKVSEGNRSYLVSSFAFYDFHVLESHLDFYVFKTSW